MTPQDLQLSRPQKALSTIVNYAANTTKNVNLYDDQQRNVISIKVSDFQIKQYTALKDTLNTAAKEAGYSYKTPPFRTAHTLDSIEPVRIQVVNHSEVNGVDFLKSIAKDQDLLEKISSAFSRKANGRKSTPQHVQVASGYQRRAADADKHLSELTGMSGLWQKRREAWH